MKQTIDPKRMILGMGSSTCTECEQIQYVWFKSKEEQKSWTCPFCSGRLSPIEDDDQQPKE